MIDVGRLCVKIAGRDAGKKCVVVEVLDNKFVLIDGETRRRKCNIVHLEPLEQTVSIEKNASHDVVVGVFKKLGIEIGVRKAKKSAVRPRTLRRSKLAKKPAEKPVEKKPAAATAKQEKKEETSAVIKEENPTAVKKPRKKSAEKVVEVK